MCEKNIIRLVYLAIFSASQTTQAPYKNSFHFQDVLTILWTEKIPNKSPTVKHNLSDCSSMHFTVDFSTAIM